MLADALHQRLKQPFVVENRPGASMQIGTSAVAKSPPDGSMLVMSSATSLAVNPNIYKSLPYDPIKDLAPVSLVGSAYFVLVANPEVGPKTLPELIAYIKARPGQLSYASAGHGTPHHLFMELFMKMAGLKMQHVPYKGSVPALTDVMSGVIPLMMVDLLPSMQLIRDGKITAFGVTTTHRVKAAPDIPTIAEAALPGYSALGWFAGDVHRDGIRVLQFDVLLRLVRGSWIELNRAKLECRTAPSTRSHAHRLQTRTNPDTVASGVHFFWTTG
jgi:tripartite-type tricarboxylate transporter receptor subunit TctC